MHQNPSLTETLDYKKYRNEPTLKTLLPLAPHVMRRDYVFLL